MGKIIFLLSLSIVYSFAQNEIQEASMDLQSACLQCHQEEQIPSSLVYRRYLMRYSTPERISEAMFRYLKNPSKTASIMPSQFFLKFPMKKKTKMDDMELRQYIHRYIEKFDVKKKLVLP